MNDEYPCHEELYDEYYDSADDIDESSDFDEEEYDPFTDAPVLPPLRWKQVMIGDAVLDVSNDGRVKIFGAETVLGQVLATVGLPLRGTPYRTYMVQVQPGEYKKYFMHDLVYYAFNGPPPTGYEVRHLPEYTAKRRTIYSNRLGCLTVVPADVSPLRLGRLT